MLDLVAIKRRLVFCLIMPFRKSRIKVLVVLFVCLGANSALSKILKRVKITKTDRQSEIRAFIEIPETGMDFNSAVNNYENALILQALEKTGWNRNQAALLLRLNRTTLVEKIKKKGLRPPETTM